MHLLCLVSLDTVLGVTTELSLFIGLRVQGLDGLLITCWAISNLRLAFLCCDCIFWVRFFYLFLTFFTVICFCFIFSNWSSGIGISGKSCTFFLSPVLQWAADICPSFQLNLSVLKWSCIATEFLIFLLGDDNISTYCHLIFAFIVVKT